MEAAGVSNNWVEFDRLICIFMELVMQELFEKSIKAVFSFSDSCCPFWVWLHLVMFVSYWQMGPFLVMSAASLEYEFCVGVDIPKMQRLWSNQIFHLREKQEPTNIFILLKGSPL